MFVEEAYPNFLFAVDGEVYDLDGNQTIVIGGAYSMDKFYRLANGWNRWPDDQPSPEMTKGNEKDLDNHRWKVDMVLSHTVPLKDEPVEVFMFCIDQSKADKSTETWLDSIEDRLTSRHRYAGHIHTGKKY